MSIEVVPAVAIYGGKIVYPEHHGYKPLIVSGELPQLLEFINNLSKRYSKVFIRDIEGIISNKPQLKLLQAICSENQIWIDAGVKFSDGIIDLFVVGAEMVILTTSKLFRLEELEAAYELSENIIFEIDYDEQGVISPVPNLNTTKVRALIDKVIKFGINNICLADLSKDSDYNKLTRSLQNKLRDLQNIVDNLRIDMKIYVKMPLSSRTNLESLEKLGAFAVFVDVRDVLKFDNEKGLGK